jgi:hypothetical protein
VKGGKMEEKSLIEKVNQADEFIEKIKQRKIKVRDLKLPRKAKVRRSKIKKGYIGVLKIDENRNISGEKVKLDGDAFDIKERTWHSTKGEEILFWKGKFPIIIQPTWSKNPIDVRKEKPTNETYGQKPIMAKMIKAVLVKSKKKGGALIWIVLAVVGFIIWQIFKGGA